jgi:divalent metal cation (Fe/Co/Zn/Cd) transporter
VGKLGTGLATNSIGLLSAAADSRPSERGASGPQRHIDFTILTCRHLPLGEAHDLVDHVGKEIEAAIPGAHVVVRAEPVAPNYHERQRCVRSSRRADFLAHESPG